MPRRQAGRGAFHKSLETVRSDPIAFGRSILKRERSEAGAWALGGLGEIVIARRLAKLPSDDWLVFHDLQRGPSDRNIDHVVVGPPGVFAINTKLRNGFVKVISSAVYVNGARTRILAAVRHEAREVAHRIGAVVGRPVDVTPVLAFVCDDALLESQPKGVVVGRAGDFPRLLEELPVRFTKCDLAPVARAVVADKTWTQQHPEIAASPSAPGTAQPNITTKVWSKYGKKRLYVTQGDDEIGYVDMLTDVAHPVHEDLRDVLETAARDFVPSRPAKGHTRDQHPR
jgi:hypothetical protein